MENLFDFLKETKAIRTKDPYSYAMVQHDIEFWNFSIFKIGFRENVTCWDHFMVRLGFISSKTFRKVDSKVK